jgi:4-hydroxyphenylpyruvate dioxygenase-like putative hemolysin
MARENLWIVWTHNDLDDLDSDEVKLRVRTRGDARAIAAALRDHGAPVVTAVGIERDDGERAYDQWERRGKTWVQTRRRGRSIPSLDDNPF